jgi:hypothetical protein
MTHLNHQRYFELGGQSLEVAQDDGGAQVGGQLRERILEHLLHR